MLDYVAPSGDGLYPSVKSVPAFVQTVIGHALSTASRYCCPDAGVPTLKPDKSGRAQPGMRTQDAMADGSRGLSTAPGRGSVPGPHRTHGADSGRPRTGSAAVRSGVDFCIVTRANPS